METISESCPKHHIQVGKEQRVAVVFSCPGRHEQIAGHPAAKATGRNLETLLSLLGEALQRDDLEREKVTITNAWAEIEYRGKTGRSEATTKEITAAANIQRLQEELNDVTDFVIFCGERAREVSSLLHLKHNPRQVFIEHLGLRGLSLIRTDVTGEPIVAAHRLAGSAREKREAACENTRKRLQVLAQSIVDQLKE